MDEGKDGECVMNEEGSPRDVRWRRCGKGTGGEGRKRKTEEKGKVEIGRRNGRGGWKPLAERAERKIEGRKIDQGAEGAMAEDGKSGSGGRR